MELALLSCEIISMGMPCLPCKRKKLSMMAFTRWYHWLSCWIKSLTYIQKQALIQAVFVDHNAYCFGKIIESLWIQEMYENKEDLTSCIYIQDLHQEHFEKIVDYLFPGESASFILQGSEINSMILSKHQSSQIGSWLSEDGVSGDLELLYRGSQDGWKTSDFSN